MQNDRDFAGRHRLVFFLSLLTTPLDRCCREPPSTTRLSRSMRPSRSVSARARSSGMRAKSRDGLNVGFMMSRYEIDYLRAKLVSSFCRNWNIHERGGGSGVV